MELPHDVCNLIATYTTCCDQRAMADAGMYTPTTKSACVWRDWMRGKCVARFPREYVATMDAILNGDGIIEFVNVAERDAFLVWACAQKVGKYTARYGLLQNTLVHIKNIGLRTWLT